MTSRARRLLVSLSAAAAAVTLPAAAVAAPPVGKCPKSFHEASIPDTPASFLTAAPKIDANDDHVVCFKPMANDTRTNVIDNVAHSR